MNEDIIKQLEASGEYRVIKRYSPVSQYHQVDGQSLKQAIFLDVETTGLDAQVDKIIELAMVPFEFDSDGIIYRVLPAYNGFQDPGIPIPDNISRITGITDEMVAGQSLDVDQIKHMIASSVLIIAHNAAFDRPFMENLLPAFEELWWACSMADIDWSAQGIESSKLEYLAYKYGFFYEGHRATIDCQAGIHILAQKLPTSRQPVMQALLQSARRTDYRLWAVNAPFEMKDILRKRGYRWSSGDDGGYKAWYIDVDSVSLDQETRFLETEIYKRTVANLPTKKITAQSRYSARLNDPTS